MSTLYLAAKGPVAGEVKTRLGATIGMPEAAALYRAFLQDLAGRFGAEPYPIGWYIAPGAWAHVAPLARRADVVRVQDGDGWAARQASLFRACFATSTEPVVLMATDSPQVPRERVREAMTLLDRHDVVFGPTPDGGYYLVGMSRLVDVFSGVAMSTASALESAVARAGAAGASVAMLEPEFDVDTVDDLPRLLAAVQRRPDLRHTAAAIGRLGVLA